jgi:iron complex transport system substrate-binding protein
MESRRDEQGTASDDVRRFGGSRSGRRRRTDRYLVAAVVGLLVAGSLGLRGCFGRLAPGSARSPAAVQGEGVELARTPSRIVSMAPSVTEVLLALGLEERLVGVTRFCRLPARVGERARIGGFLDPNYEAIVALVPDLVILIPESLDPRGRLPDLGIPVLVTQQMSVRDILGSIRTVGRVCEVEERAEGLVNEIDGCLDRVRARVEGRPRPSVLVCVGRRLGGGVSGNVYIAGKETFYDDLVRIAGGRNAYEGGGVRYPGLSLEGLLRLDPDVILDIVPEVEAERLDPQAIRRDWSSIDGLRAPSNGGVHLLTADYVSVPGPRIVELLGDLVDILHPRPEPAPQQPLHGRSDP